MLGGLYVSRPSLVHRLPAGLKLAIVAAAGIGVFFLDDPIVLAGVLAVSAAIALIARLPVLNVARHFAPFLALIALFFAFHAIFTSVLTGWVIVARFAVMILLGLYLGMTTRTSALVAAIETALGPLRVFGIDPERVSLVLSMTVRFMPLVAETYADIAAAQKARGLERNVLAVMIPLLVRLLQRADDIADSLVARGVGEGPADKRP